MPYQGINVNTLGRRESENPVFNSMKIITLIFLATLAIGCSRAANNEVRESPPVSSNANRASTNAKNGSDPAITTTQRNSSEPALAPTPRNDYDPAMVGRAAESMKRLELVLKSEKPSDPPDKLLSEVERNVVQALGRTENARLADSLRRALESYQQAVSLSTRRERNTKLIEISLKMQSIHLETQKKLRDAGASSSLYSQYARDYEKEKAKSDELWKEARELNSQISSALTQARTETAIIESILNSKR